jgi:peptide/nickel transport system substrate-binding protein
MKKIAMSLLVLSMVFALFAGGSGDSTEAGAAQAPVRTDLNLATYLTFPSFDPFGNIPLPAYLFLRNIYEPLYTGVSTQKEDGTTEREYRPMLAESYEISSDGTVYTFQIRKGVKFHNGLELKASDVEYSYKLAMRSPATMSYTMSIADVQATDEYTVAITLKTPFSPFLENVSFILIVNETFAEEAGKAVSEETCGTGPYYLSEVITDQKYVLAAFKDYFRGEASVKTITTKIIPDPSTLAIAFESGELDMINVPAANWQQISSSAQYKSYKYVEPKTLLLALNTTKPPFDNALLRQAVNYAIDRESISIIAYDGNNKPAHYIVPEGVVFGAAEPDDPYTYDPAKARQLLTEAGYPNGLEISSIKSPGGESAKMSQVIQQNLADVGISCEIDILEINTLFQSYEKGDFDLGTMGFFCLKDFFNVDLLLTMKYGPGPNPARYSNPRVDALFDEGIREYDPAEREKIYKQIINIVNEDAPYAPLVFVEERIATHPRLAFDVPVDSLTYYDLYWTN